MPRLLGLVAGLFLYCSGLTFAADSKEMVAPAMKSAKEFHEAFVEARDSIVTAVKTKDPDKEQGAKNAFNDATGAADAVVSVLESVGSTDKPVRVVQFVNDSKEDIEKAQSAFLEAIKAEAITSVVTPQDATAAGETVNKAAEAAFAGYETALAELEKPPAPPAPGAPGDFSGGKQKEEEGLTEELKELIALQKKLMETQTTLQQQFFSSQKELVNQQLRLLQASTLQMETTPFPSIVFKNSTVSERLALASGTGATVVKKDQIGRNVHLIIVADTLSLKGANVSRDQYFALFQREAVVNGQNRLPNPQVLDDGDCTPQALSNAIAKVKRDNPDLERDALVVIYLGHGGTTNGEHVFQFRIVQRDIRRASVRQMAQETKAGLVMLISDACGDRFSGRPVDLPVSEVASAAFPSRLKTILFGKAGVWDINGCGARAGQFGVYNSEKGGWFSQALIQTFGERADSDGVTFARIQNLAAAGIKEIFDRHPKDASGRAIISSDRIVLPVPERFKLQSPSRAGN